MKAPIFFIGEKLTRATRQWLQKQQIQYIEQPFFRIEYKKPNLSFFEPISREPKQWVVTSIYAAHWLVRFSARIGITPGDRLYCWSEKQAAILKKLDLPVFVSAYSDVNELAEQVISGHTGESVILLLGDKLHTELAGIFAAKQVSVLEVEVYKNTPIEQFVGGIFDAYLFFSPTGIESFKASGNIPNPASLILVNESATARTAWRVFTNKVYLSAEQDELAFVQSSVSRWQQENNH